VITTEITMAKFGRWMRTRESIAQPARFEIDMVGCGSGLTFWPGCTICTPSTITCFAARQALRDDEILADLRTQPDALFVHRVVRRDQQHESALLILLHRRHRHQRFSPRLRGMYLDRSENARQQQAFRIVEAPPYADRPGRRVHLIVDELGPPLVTLRCSVR
jgi:hypothetical protein